MPGLEAGNVLCLKAFRAFLDFKFNCLALVQGFISVHLNCGEVNKDILSGLALDEPVTLRSIEPLHCSLFLHCTNLEIEIALPLLVRLLVTSQR